MIFTIFVIIKAVIRNLITSKIILPIKAPPFALYFSLFIARLQNNSLIIQLQIHNSCLGCPNQIIRCNFDLNSTLATTDADLVLQNYSFIDKGTKLFLNQQIFSCKTRYALTSYSYAPDSRCCALNSCCCALNSCCCASN